ncbi:MAG: YifB family Mg chelatase-like AAA ATPase [Lachnospiraceae bacterium]|nr:YifB family Mg chelatase-like AAA ATPase [Lachnospiraceae bacterium]
MLSTITSGAVYGVHSHLIQVEVDISQGLPCFQIVGLPGSEVREARERVKVALKNVGIKLPPMCINVNLSPADLPKNGTMFDLPVAVGIMIALGKLKQESVEGTLLLGELGLSGELKPVRGVLPIAREGALRGIRRCVVPAGNAWEGALVGELESIGIRDVKEAVALLAGEDVSVGDGKRAEAETMPVCEGDAVVEAGGQERLDFFQISGQQGLKRAAEVAAAGFHNLLIIGAPGSGKTMLARRIPSILPPLTREESLEVSAIYSICGLLQSVGSLRTTRPFLNPHHTITGRALAGGGRIPAPGVISLAHRGVLFLDELPEFKRETLDILRQPLEDKRVQIARSSGTYVYPADFMLVGAMNPCPCGFYPDRERCRCSPFEVKRYLNRVSGPILDRMDICVEALPMAFADMTSGRREEGSAQVRERVMAARKRQESRFAGTGLHFNADMGAGDVARYCALGEAELRYMERMFSALQFSARAYHRILKVARTIADLDGSDGIGEMHLAEAICYRQSDHKYWN